MTNAICIGGVLDGHVVDTESKGQRWAGEAEMSTTKARETFEKALGMMAAAQITVERSVYTLRQITGPAEPIYFYTADGITEHGAIVRVFQAYRKAK